jgi:hypothetical protein
MQQHRSSNPVSPASSKSPGLQSLSTVELDDGRRFLLDQASRRCDGDPWWRQRKLLELQEILALSQIAPRGRLAIDWIDSRSDLRVLLHLKVPVPCRAGGDAELQIVGSAKLGFVYPREAVRSPLPGWAFFQVLSPCDVWHANVGRPVPNLCLGASLPAGVRARSLILLAYGALSMQTVQVDEVDPAGVLNLEAALWWQRNLDKAPLSRIPFLAEAPGEPGGREVLP